MSRFQVTAPTAFSGSSAGVMFADGVATLDTNNNVHARALAYFARKGYAVSRADTPAEDTEVTEVVEVVAEVPEDTKTTTKKGGRA